MLNFLPNSVYTGLNKVPISKRITGVVSGILVSLGRKSRCWYTSQKQQRIGKTL